MSFKEVHIFSTPQTSTTKQLDTSNKMSDEQNTNGEQKTHMLPSNMNNEDIMDLGRMLDMINKRDGHMELKHTESLFICMNSEEPCTVKVVSGVAEMDGVLLPANTVINIPCHQDVLIDTMTWCSLVVTTKRRHFKCDNNHTFNLFSIALHDIMYRTMVVSCQNNTTKILVEYCKRRGNQVVIVDLDHTSNDFTPYGMIGVSGVSNSNYRVRLRDPDELMKVYGSFWKDVSSKIQADACVIFNCFSCKTIQDPSLFRMIVKSFQIQSVIVVGDERLYYTQSMLLRHVRFTKIKDMPTMMKVEVGTSGQQYHINKIKGIVSSPLQAPLTCLPLGAKRSKSSTATFMEGSSSLVNDTVYSVCLSSSPPINVNVPIVAIVVYDKRMNTLTIKAGLLMDALEFYLIE